MFTLLVSALLHAQEFTVTYQCRPEHVNIYDDTGLRKVHTSRWDSGWLIGEASGYAQAVEASRAKIQEAFRRARDQAAELQYFTVSGMICRKRLAAGGDPDWNNLYGRDNRMRYAPANRLRDERELKVGRKAQGTYASEPTL